jgi:hypothetical protein
VTDVNVSIRFAKGLVVLPLNNQVHYSLTSPSGTTVNLIPANLWGAGTLLPSGYVTMTFDDSASTAVTSTSKPTTGTFRPSSALSAFNGSAATGTWTLNIQDTALLQPLFHDDVKVTVTANEPPTNVSAGGPYTISEGDSLTLSGSATDPESATLTYSWDVNGDGTFGDATGANPTLTWAQLNALGITDGFVGSTRDVSVRVSDGVTDPVTSTSTLLSIDNTAPTAASMNGPAVLALGGSGNYSLNGVFDPSPVDTGSLHYSFATSPGGLAANYAAAGGANSFNFSSPTLGSYTIYGRVYDKDGGISATYSTTVLVNAGSNFDMKASVSAPPVEGWKKAWQGTQYSATTGYGWSRTSSVGGGTGGLAPSEGNAAVMSDYAYGQTAATFQVYVGAFQSATVRIYSYGTAAQGRPGVAAKIGSGPTSTLTTNGVLTISGTAGADGILNITFNRGTGKAMWVVSAIEVNGGGNR